MTTPIYDQLVSELGDPLSRYTSPEPMPQKKEEEDDEQSVSRHRVQD